MMEWLFSSLWGWIGITGAIVVGAIAVAVFFPPFRNTALAVAGAALAVGSIYAKGQRDRAALEKKRRDEAVAKARAAYQKIDEKREKETEDEFIQRLEKGEFGGRRH